LAGSGCPRCGKTKCANSRRLTHADVVSRTAGRNITILTKYAGARKPMTFRCDVHGSTWTTTPDAVINRKCGCPTCGMEKSATARRLENMVIEDHGDWVLIDVSTSSHPDATMKIDKDDYDRLKSNYKMLISRGYVKANARNLKGRGSMITVHRVILGLQKSFEIKIDHVNHDTTDNRKDNLRIATNSQNIMNSKIQTRNKSGCKGVHFVKRDQKWLARISANKKDVYLGLHTSLNAAIAARKAAEAKYHGEFAYNPTQDATLFPQKSLELPSTACQSVGV